VGPRHWTLFSIFGQQHEIALDTVREQCALSGSGGRVIAKCHAANAPRHNEVTATNYTAVVPYGLPVFNYRSLIERTFLLRCLGNNAFEYLAKARGANDNRGAPVY
jgi:hypothetical protein